ncbi:ion transporter [Reinekea blandensis]|uniref:ion transporter n=1 Tax=Reinekea blandensis TaxID=374838 RepID=UPI0003220861|nr:ion transporter [Reinekea blandensis]
MSSRGSLATEIPNWVEWLSISLVLFSSVSIVITTVPNLPILVLRFFEFSEYVVLTVFIVEYFYRLYLSSEKRQYLFSFYSIVDLIAILPSLLIPTMDLRSVRLIRLLRLTRLLKLLKYQNALRRFRLAMRESREELILWLLISFVLLFMAAVGVYHAENSAQPDVYKTIGDSLWWAVATLTTVGYGDIYPVTIVGKILTTVILILGLGMIAMPTAIITSSLASVKKSSMKDDS